MKRLKPIESLLLTIRGRKVLVDADLAAIYGVETRTLNQAVKRNAERFPEDFIFTLNAAEKLEVITNCDHLARLKFAKSLPFAFTEHGAIMAATVLNSAQAVAMSIYVVRAFIQMREQLAANSEVLRRLAEIDKTLLQHNARLRDI
jgi:ORF6N domain